MRLTNDTVAELPSGQLKKFAYRTFRRGITDAILVDETVFAQDMPAFIEELNTHNVTALYVTANGSALLENIAALTDREGAAQFTIQSRTESLGSTPALVLCRLGAPARIG